jgi:nitrogen regulatory protein PII
MPRHRGEQLVEITKAAGARGGTIIPGRASANNRLLQFLSLADVDQDVVITIMGQETETVLSSIVKAAQDTTQKIRGLAMLLDVSGMLFRIPGHELEKNLESDSDMQSEYKLITIIVNHGYADEVMHAARKAGATGGTIVTARGTGTEEDVKFFGISLVPEKEMLMIIAKTETMPAILEAVSCLPIITKPGAGIIFHMNVECFLPLGKQI